MNVTRGRVVQDMLYMIMTAVVAGVLFSMAVAGVVFLLSGPTRADRIAGGSATREPALRGGDATTQAPAGEQVKAPRG